MVAKITDVPAIYCQHCGGKLERRQFQHRMEAVKTYLARKYCSHSCQSKHQYAEVAEALQHVPYVPPPADTAYEHWRPFEDYAGYFVSDCGRVWSTRTRPARILKPHLNQEGYLKVHLAVGDFSIHQMVLTAFDKPCPPGMQTRHLDGNRTNNHISNLAWGTAQENADDRARHGTDKSWRQHRNTRLSAEEVKAMRAERENGASLAELSEKYQVRLSHIVRVVKGRSWKHI